MRSMAFKAALAAILVSTPLATAFAKEHHGTMREFSFQNSPSGGDKPDSPAPSDGYATGGQLRAILDDLQGDNARLMSDRHAKLITPAELRGLRGEEAMIRRTAIRDSARDGGKIPAGQYDRLMAEVNDLGMQIDHDAALH
ncbi:hypothetical protein SLT36_06435 [Aminobacter sp. BA135]|uniref:hypothetical protein n=1 Tax=Aminobacter sp. BA135 TaxID=537596 RepID=UPI003D797566